MIVQANSAHNTEQYQTNIRDSHDHSVVHVCHIVYLVINEFSYVYVDKILFEMINEIPLNIATFDDWRPLNDDEAPVCMALPFQRKCYLITHCVPEMGLCTAPVLITKSLSGYSMGYVSNDWLYKSRDSLQVKFGLFVFKEQDGLKKTKPKNTLTTDMIQIWVFYTM